mmetsp:Transcript_8156/g.13530  ORF Transcript_8156/g.13530 Transcript_8156/m.13530 type:complete len:252 (-) Transcript_8156:1460-2215(-)
MLEQHLDAIQDIIETGQGLAREPLVKDKGITVRVLVELGQSSITSSSSFAVHRRKFRQGRNLIRHTSGSFKLLRGQVGDSRLFFWSLLNGAQVTQQCIAETALSNRCSVHLEFFTFHLGSEFIVTTLKVGLELACNRLLDGTTRIANTNRVNHFHALGERRFTWKSHGVGLNRVVGCILVVQGATKGLHNVAKSIFGLLVVHGLKDEGSVQLLTSFPSVEAVRIVRKQKGERRFILDTRIGNELDRSRKVT